MGGGDVWGAGDSIYGAERDEDVSALGWTIFGGIVLSNPANTEY